MFAISKRAVDALPHAQLQRVQRDAHSQLGCCALQRQVFAVEFHSIRYFEDEIYKCDVFRNIIEGFIYTLLPTRMIVALWDTIPELI